MLTSPTIRNQIDVLTSLGNQSLSQAVGTGSYADYAKAIQEFSSAYKFALLLNASDGTQERCCFNLGAANIAGGDIERGIALLETVLEFSDDRIEDAEKDFKTYRGDAFFNLGVGHEKLQHSEKAVKNFSGALLEYNRQNNSKRTCETYLKIANIHNRNLNFAEARRNFQNASKVYQKADEIGNSLMARVCEANAAYKDKTFNSSEIIKLLDSICKDYSDVKSKNSQGKIMCEAGLLYGMLRHYDSALYCFNESIKLCSRAANLQRLAIALQNAGSILNRLGYYQEAIPKHFQASRLHGLIQNRNLQGHSFYHLGVAHNELGQLDDAWEAFLHALKAFEDSDDKSGRCRCHERLGILAFNEGRSAKATWHFKSALECLSVPVGEDDEVRERIVDKLSEAVKLLRSKNTTPKQPKEKSVSTAPIDDAEPPDTPDAPVPVFDDDADGDSAKDTKKTRLKKRRQLDRGRRGYSDEQDRPMQHVARGMSNLTDFTTSSLRNEDASESTSSDSDESLSDSTRLKIRSISADGSVTDQKQFMKRRTRQKHLRKLVQAATLPISSLSTMQEEEQSPRKDENDDAFDDTQNMKQYYRHQLGNIREASSENDDLTDVTDASLDSSSSDNDRRKTSTSSKVKENDDLGKARNAYDTLPSLPISKDETTSGTQSLDNAHLYTRVRRVSQQKDTSEPGKLKAENGNSSNVDVTDGNRSILERADESSISSSSQTKRNEYDESPEVPVPPPRTKLSEKGQMKNTNSKCCVIM